MKQITFINDTLEECGLFLTGGTMDHTTIIRVPPPTKNQARYRACEMQETNKRKPWRFGAKNRIGADVDSGLVRTVSMTPVEASDIGQLPHLVREDDRAVFFDTGFKSRIGCAKVRYEGGGKASAQVFSLIGLMSPCLARRAKMN